VGRVHSELRCSPSDLHLHEEDRSHSNSNVQVKWYADDCSPTVWLFKYRRQAFHSVGDRGVGELSSLGRHVVESIG